MKPTSTPPINLIQFKREAIRRKQETGKKLGHVLEQMAQELGFRTYAALRAALKETA